MSRAYSVSGRVQVAPLNTQGTQEMGPSPSHHISLREETNVQVKLPKLKLLPNWRLGTRTQILLNCPPVLSTDFH